VRARAGEAGVEAVAVGQLVVEHAEQAVVRRGVGDAVEQAGLHHRGHPSVGRAVHHQGGGFEALEVPRVVPLLVEGVVVAVREHDTGEHLGLAANPFEEALGAVLRVRQLREVRRRAAGALEEMGHAVVVVELVRRRRRRADHERLERRQPRSVGSGGGGQLGAAWVRHAIHADRTGRPRRERPGVLDDAGAVVDLVVVELGDAAAAAAGAADVGERDREPAWHEQVDGLLEVRAAPRRVRRVHEDDGQPFGRHVGADGPGQPGLGVDVDAV
jgi:hypothetical protein